MSPVVLLALFKNELFLSTDKMYTFKQPNNPLVSEFVHTSLQVSKFDQ